MAGDGLFIDKISNRFGPAEVETFIKALSKNGGAGSRSLSSRAAELIACHGADATTVAAALLLQPLRDGLFELDGIREEFGEAVADTLDGLKTPFILSNESQPNDRGHTRALLGFLTKSPRKALLLIALRLAELEEAVDVYRSDLSRIAQETVEFYVPIANRLSLGELRRRLEDMCFKILEPDEHEKLKHQVGPIQAEDDRCLEILTKGVRRLLNKSGVAAEIQARTKSLHAIRRKMARTGRNLDAIMDRIGVRIIVASVPECYTVLGLLHTHFKPISGTFDDYIGLPKANGYQSLHTCVYPVREISHKPIEFQIRTKLMHAEAEHGVAAHWLYKNGSAAADQENDQAQWMAGLARQHIEAENDEAFIELLHRQVFQDHVVVFGNGGRIVRLGENATVRDFLKIINVQVPEGGHVEVNGRIAAVSQSLRDGDSIEIVPTPRPIGGKAEGDGLAGHPWWIDA